MSEQAARHKRGYLGYAAIGAVTLVYAVVLVRTAWLCDDSYITFRTVGNFISGYGLRWNIDERVQAYTHPLWMFLLSGLFCLTANIYYSAIFSSIVLSLAAVLVYALGIARTAWHAVLGLTILLFSKAFVDYSTSGLENPLSYLLVALFVMLYLQGERVSGVGGRGSGNDDSGGRSGSDRNRNNDDPPEVEISKRLFRLSGLAGLIAVNRMDLILLVGPALVHAFWHAAARRSESRAMSHPEWSSLPRASGASRGEESGCSLVPTRRRVTEAVGLVLLGFAPFIAWEIFSIIYYGFPFPNTAYAKLNTGIPAADLIRQGLYYFSESLRNDRVTLPAIACAVVGAGLSRQGRKIALAVGIVLYLLYTVRIGGDFMSGRYFAVPLLAGVAVLGTMDVRSRAAKAAWPAGMVATVALGLLSPNPSLLTGGAYGLVGDNLVDAHGIADERGWYYIFTGLLRSNPKWGHRILREAQKVRERGDTVVVTADTIGLFGYNVGPNVHIVDVFALADPLLARLPMKPGLKWRIGHFERDVPPEYVESLRTGQNDLVDPQVRDLYDQILQVTRGPLFTWQRWKAIWRLNIGVHLQSSRPVSNMPRV